MRSVSSPKLMAAWAVIASLALAWLFFSDGMQQLRAPSFRNDAPSAPELDSYVRNESWETGFLPSVPYRKGDVLEFAFFAEYLHPYTYGFDWTSLFERFDFISLTVDGVETDPSSLRYKPFSWSSKAVLRLRAKTNGTTNSDPFALPKIAESESPSSERVPLASTGELVSTGAVELSADSLGLALSDFSSDVNNAVTVTGAPKSTILGIVIGSKVFKGADHGSGYVFVVDRWTFADGDYFVAAYSKEGKLVPVRGKLSFRSDGQSVGVSYVTPSSVPNSRESYVTLQGRWFSKVVSIQLSNSLVIKNASFRAVDDSVAIVKIPAGIPAWEYAMNVMDVKGISSPKNALIRITSK